MRRSVVIALVIALVSLSLSGRAAAAAFTVDGTVLKPDGTPAAGVLVRADNSFGGAVIAMTTTDASGHYSFSLDAGTYTFAYIPSDNTLATQVYDGQRSTAMASTQTPIAANTTLNTQTLVAAHLVKGQVTRESDGAPIANADVWFLLGGTQFCCYFVRGAVTDASGNYEVGLATGTWKAWSRAAGYESEWYLGMDADYGHAGWLSATDITVGSATVTGIDFTLRAPSADLAVTLADSTDPAQIGAIYSYTVTVANAGPATVDAEVSLALPSNLVLTGTQTGCALTSPVVCTFASIASGATTSRIVFVQATSGTSATVTATLGGPFSDPDMTDNVATETTTLTAPPADLSVFLTDSADPVLSTYLSYSYTAVVANLGPSTPTNVIVTFTLSSNLTYLGGSGCLATLPTVTCAVGAVTVPVVATPTIHVRPDGGGTSATVSAVVSSELADPVATNDTDTETTAITPVADLELVSLTGPANATGGDLVTFTATARNNSTLYAIPQSGIEISLPAGMTFQSISGSATASSCVPPSGTWPAACLFGPLAPGAQESVTLTAVAASPGSYMIVAQTGNLGSVIEFDIANNTMPVGLTVTGEAASGNLSPGTSVTTDSEGDGATIADPVETTVLASGGLSGPVTITEMPTTGTPPSGWTFFGQQVVITAPAATALNPLTIVFDINGSVIPSGQTLSTIQIFRNGAPVADCTASGPIVPDPCVGGRLASSTGVRIHVMTSAASTWNLGFHVPFTFQGFSAPLDGQRTTVRAGSTLPVKFSLGGDQGTHVLAAAYTTSCGSATRTNITASALRYDAAEGQYILNWRTDRTWSGCRELVLELTDGSSHRATLQFR